LIIIDISIFKTLFLKIPRHDNTVSSCFISLKKISVSPNPTSDLVTITLEGSFVYSLFGVNGVVLATKKGVNQAQLDLSDFTYGMYFLEIQSENGSETVKLVKQ